jgi:hypothetical protein
VHAAHWNDTDGRGAALTREAFLGDVKRADPFGGIGPPPECIARGAGDAADSGVLDTDGWDLIAILLGLGVCTGRCPYGEIFGAALGATAMSPYEYMTLNNRGLVRLSYGRLCEGHNPSCKAAPSGGKEADATAITRNDKRVIFIRKIRCLGSQWGVTFFAAE